jgi:hypothetical protein
MAHGNLEKSCTYRVGRRLPGDITHGRHGFDGYYTFDREVSLIIDTQEARGLPEKL